VFLPFSAANVVDFIPGQVRAVYVESGYVADISILLVLGVPVAGDPDGVVLGENGIEDWLPSHLDFPRASDGNRTRVLSLGS
jgi:hypothetical protein